MVGPALSCRVFDSLFSACLPKCAPPAAVRRHAAGTFDKSDGSGGTDGATMRFEPEKSDPANAGLSIIRDLL